MGLGHHVKDSHRKKSNPVHQTVNRKCARHLFRKFFLCVKGRFCARFTEQTLSMPSMLPGRLPLRIDNCLIHPRANNLSVNSTRLTHHANRGPCRHLQHFRNRYRDAIEKPYRTKRQCDREKVHRHVYLYLPVSLSSRKTSFHLISTEQCI